MSNILTAQEHVIHGVVHAFDSIPLIGAEVIVKSIKQSFFTDNQGNVLIFCNSKDKLKIRAEGFSTRNVKITENIKLVAKNLKLKQSLKKTGDERKEYAIEYGHVLERDKTTTTESLQKNEAAFSRYSNMYELIQGQFAGVEVATNGEIIIRGVNSFNSSSAALIVVDGVIMGSDILRIFVLLKLIPIMLLKTEALRSMVPGEQIA